MIEQSLGNLLEAPAEALVNAVNTVGVMGRGIALQFKKAYPQMFRAYEEACWAGHVWVGKVHAHDLGAGASPRWILNFPTKEHWKDPSRLSYIERGLPDLTSKVRELGIGSLAVPALGCGLGGLPWNAVRSLIESAFRELPEVRVLLFPPR